MISEPRKGQGRPVRVGEGQSSPRRPQESREGQENIWKARTPKETSGDPRRGQGIQMAMSFQQLLSSLSVRLPEFLRGWRITPTS